MQAFIKKLLMTQHTFKTLQYVTDRGGNDGTGEVAHLVRLEVNEGGNISMYNLDGFYQQEDNNNVRQDFFYECSLASACLSCDDARNKRNESVERIQRKEF